MNNQEMAEDVYQDTKTRLCQFVSGFHPLCVQTMLTDMKVAAFFCIFILVGSKCSGEFSSVSLMPRNLKAVEVGMTYITLEWDAPDNNGSDYIYKIESVPNINTPALYRHLNIQLLQLTPGTLYNISVTTISDKKQSSPVYISQLTFPDKPRITETDITSDTLKFEWTVRGTVDLFILQLCEYIRSHTANCSYDTTYEMSKTFNSLKSNTQYELIISAVRGNFTGLPVRKKIKTKEITSVQNLTMLNIRARNFSVKFSDPTLMEHQLVTYVMYFTNKRDSSFSKCVLLKVSGQNCKNQTFLSNCSTAKDNELIINGSSVVYTGLTDALPDSEYTVEVIAQRCHGMSKSVIVQGITEIGVPEPVRKLNVTNSESNKSKTVSLNVTWLPPEFRSGPTNYTVEVVNAVKNHPDKGCFIIGYENTGCQIEDLLPFWEYNVTVTALTSAGKKGKMLSLVTMDLEPGKPEIIQVSRPQNTYQFGHLIMFDPKQEKRNTHILGYIIIVQSTITAKQFCFRSDFSKLGNNQSGSENIYSCICSVVPKMSTKQLLCFNESTISEEQEKTYRRTKSYKYEINFPVIPDNNYSIFVYSVGRQNKLSSEPVNASYYSPVGYPPDWTGHTISGPVLEYTTTSFLVEFNNAEFFINSNNGKIQFCGLIISNVIWKSSEKYFSYNEILKHTWIEAVRNRSKNLPYSYMIDLAYLKDEQYDRLCVEIGTESNCESEDIKYCNGKLQPDTTYYVRAFTCTSVGCTMSPVGGPYTTSAEENIYVGVYAGSIIPVILLVLIITLLAIWRAKRTRTVNKRSSTSLSLVSINLPKVSRNRPIKLSDLKARVAEMHKDSNLLFASEYADLNTLSPEHPSNASQLDENKPKNRFTNVIPFDQSRVTLKQIENEDSSDYINASFIDGYNRENEYIAAQGPLPSTIDDFWRLIWEQNVSIIVMVTPLKECGKIKCEQYWPSDTFDPREYGDIIVENTSTSTINTYTLSVLGVKHSKSDEEVHTVYHFHFLNWKDMTADLEAHSLLDFVKTVRSYVRGDMTGPILVHCSAGVGRTGTFITMDYLYQFIRDHDLDDEVDIFGFILKMRDRRVIMVQAESQYVFIHDAAVALVDDKVRAMRLAIKDEEEESLIKEPDDLTEISNCDLNNVSSNDDVLCFADIGSLEDESYLSSSTSKLVTEL